jgi:hypothetical protein
MAAPLVVIPALAVVALEQRGEARAQSARAVEAAKKVTDEYNRAQNETRIARERKLTSDQRWYVAEIGLTNQARRDGLMGLLWKRLRSLEPQGTQNPDLRGFEWHYLATQGGSILDTIRLLDVPSTTLAFDHGGRRLVAAALDGYVRVFGADHPHEEPVTVRAHCCSNLGGTFDPGPLPPTRGRLAGGSTPANGLYLDKLKKTKILNASSAGEPRHRPQRGSSARARRKPVRNRRLSKTGPHSSSSRAQSVRCRGAAFLFEGAFVATAAPRSGAAARAIAGSRP